jgi:cell surface protein SprA
VCGILSLCLWDAAAKSQAVRQQVSSLVPPPGDTTRDTVGRDTLRFPISDRYGAPFGEPARRTIDLADPSVIQDSLRYDPITQRYYFEEKIGDHDYRPPTYIDYQDYLRLQGRKQEDAYWMERSGAMTGLNRTGEGPELYRGPLLFNRIFGGTQADIRPQGNLNITFGYEGQNYKNLILPERARKTGGFVFPMSINMNVVGQIGTKLKLTSNYNTQSVNDFDKQIKLEYTGGDNDIIKKIEAGNVSFPLRSQLITGVQSLFGVRTQLQFGRLTMTNVFSIQKSRKQNLMVQGGAQTSRFDIQADQYEENQHFLMAQYFHDNFDEAMSNLPIIRSQVHITRLEVWVTNKSGATTNTRNIVGLMDLGESKPYNTNIHSLSSNPLPQNGANDEYQRLASDAAARNSGTVISRLQGMGLQPVQDFEKTFARKLDSTEYVFNDQIGYLSLYRQLQPDEVLAVAFQYTYNGHVYQVGEFSQDVPPDSSQAQPKVLFLKLLKATSARPRLPIWQLMMKNIYNLGASQVNREDFQLNIFYQDPGGGERRYLPDAQGAYTGRPLLGILNLDRLNNQNDPQPDGVFDFVEGFTVNSNTGRVIFPELEPFGRDLVKAFGGDSTLASKYLYQVLYDSTKTIAQQFPQFNRYVMRGSFKANSSSDIFLGAYNVPRGSVTVNAGGQQLIENVDYTIDYSTGRLRIINDAILNSGLPINVQFENNAQFGQQTRNYFGTRLDYYVNDKLSLGATAIRMTEKPYFNIVNYGEDPIANTIVGLDANYRSDLPGVTRWLDKLPNFSTNATSSLTASGEVARLFPGHSKLIGKGDQGTVYLDDFEGASSSFDLKFPYNSWALASTPQGATDVNGNILFPESTLMDSLRYGDNRALLAWYTIEPSLVDGGPNMPANIKADKTQYLSHYVRLIKQQEVFPQQSVDFGQGYLTTLDLAYYPNQRGPYNFSTSPADIDDKGHFLHPEDKWGGIMRALNNTDFEASNVQYIEFWVMDPFLDDPSSSGGDLYINLGNVSEDILRDGLISFENGLPKPSDTAKVNTSRWGRVPRFQQQLTNAFDNDPASRAYQDVGYDGIDDQQERSFRQAYLQSLLQNFGAGSTVYQEAASDPDNDNYHYYRGADYDAGKLSILERYKKFNNSQNNSPVSGPKDLYSSAATNYPETEDINHDNTINESEEYFQYRIHFRPNMDVGSNFIVDKIVVAANQQNGPLTPETWYQFRIPVEQYNKRVGDIPDFKSIRFMRMFLTNFQDSVVLRFAKLDLVRNQWMNYKYQLDTSGAYIPIDPNSGTNFSVSAVNWEENATRKPIPYFIPPGIQRQTQLSSNNVNLYLNEQSMSMKVTNLQNGHARAVFKNLGFDLRQYKHLQMFIHAESVEGDAQLKDSDVEAVIRLGSDFVNNYYEYRIPLKITDPMGALNPSTVWPESNNLDIDLNIFPTLKQERNQSGAPISQPYTIQDSRGNYVTVVGNPNLGDVREALLGILNPKAGQISGPDDGFPKSVEVWFDELRVSDLDESGGYAALGRMDLQLADLGTLTVAGSMHTQGFGSVDQNVNERFKDNYYQYDVATNLELGKLLPQRWNLSIPVYAGYSQTISNPEYDPYDLDIKLKDKLRLARSKHERDSILEQAQDFTSIKSLSFTNVRKLPDADKKTHHLWDLENFDLSYSFSQILSHNPLIQSDELTQQKLGIGYNFTGQNKFIAPLRNLIKTNSRYLSLIRDFNINPVPSLISIRGEINRQFGATRVRNIGGGPFEIPQTFDKYFTFDRYYNLHWDLTRSLNIDFSAVNNSRIDEPFGFIDTKEKKDTLWNNLKHFGRTTMFHQTATATYTLPLNKFPLLDWANVRLGYSADYGWTAASQLALYLGNSIQNSYRKQVNGDFNFNQLYNKWTFLRSINNPVPRKRPSDSTRKTNGRDEQAAGPSPLLRALIRPLLMLKRVAINYSENASTFLPGYVDSTGFMGQNWYDMKPGLKFAFGWQPTKRWMDHIAEEGWLTPDSTFNIQFQQQFIQQLDLQATLEPFPDLRIDLNLSKSFSKNHTELFKDTSGGSGFAHLNPYDAGGFQVTYLSLRTLFNKVNLNTGISKTFQNFENYREIISRRLGSKNPYTDGKPDPNDPNYKLGYSRYAQDVLIPAFLAAYTGKDPEKIGLLNNHNSGIRSNPFSNVSPFPNWKIKYNGLSKLPFFSNFITNLTLSNGYSSILSMNSYSSSLLYADPLQFGYPGFIDSLSGNYIPYFLVPNITISEQLNPMIGIDATFTNNLNISFAFSKSRMLSLSLVDFQLTEMRSTEVDFGAGFRIRNFPLPFNIGKAKKLHNDLNFRLDLGLRDDKTVNNLLDADLVIPTSGQKIVTIAPSIDYVVNQRLNLHFFYNRRQTIPVISTSFPISNTEAGVTLRFILQ